LSTINRTYVSIAIVGRPSVNTNRPVSTTSTRNRSKNTIANSGSDNNLSSAAKSSGNSRTSIGSASSHKHSGQPAQSVSTHPPQIDQKPIHKQVFCQSDRTEPYPKPDPTFSAGSS
jgi:hypothetical protein